ncbi:hypothetical protein BDZ91DRAFT_768304 [Kalaharituber pfeilii]|nr:hypothetical protein BDZ91DRAFT_768304 [Kalaharituber pfeilii]
MMHHIRDSDGGYFYQKIGQALLNSCLQWVYLRIIANQTMLYHLAPCASVDHDDQARRSLPRARQALHDRVHFEMSLGGKQRGSLVWLKVVNGSNSRHSEYSFSQPRGPHRGDTFTTREHHQKNIFALTKTLNLSADRRSSMSWLETVLGTDSDLAIVSLQEIALGILQVLVKYNYGRANNVNVFVAITSLL